MNHANPRLRHSGAMLATLMPLLLLLPCACDRAGSSADTRPASGATSRGAESAPAHDDHADEVKLTADAIKRHGVRVGVAVARRLAPTLKAPARVMFNGEAIAHVGSPLRGRVTELRRVGELVKQGEPLFALDSTDLGDAQNDFLLKRAAVTTAKPAVELALSSFERAKAFMEKSQGMSLTDVQRREAEYRLALAQLQMAQASETSAKSKLTLLGMNGVAITALAETATVSPRHVVVAPIAGQIVEREITLGELVGPERDALMVVADLSHLWVMVDVPESQAGLIAVGARARVIVRTPTLIAVEGRVTFIPPVVDAETRTLAVRVEVAGGGDVLRAGMFAEAEIDGRLAGAESVAVPDEAVQTVKGHTVVFVPHAGEEGAFVKRAVIVGDVVQGIVPVLSGLTAGEAVVLAGSFILKAELEKGSAKEED